MNGRDPRRFGPLPLKFHATEKFKTNHLRNRRYTYVQSADGRYRNETIFVGNDSGYPTQTTTWDGNVRLINGLPAAGDTPKRGVQRFAISDTTPASGYPGELEALLPVFAGPEAPTRRLDVMGFDDGTLSLGEDGTVRMTIHFVDMKTLAYDRVIHFAADGTQEYAFTVQAWIHRGGAAFPEITAGRYRHQGIEGEAFLVLVSMRSADETDETFTQTIPWVDGVTIAEIDGSKQISVLEYDKKMIEGKPRPDS